MDDHEELEQHTDRNAPALALSGGGFRATLFHCGALLRLNDLGILPRVARVASVSGGSITAGKLALEWGQLTLRDGRFTDLQDRVIAPLRRFCSRTIDIPAAAIGTLLPFTSAGARLAKAYEGLFGTATLQDLPDRPDFVFKATNLKTGRLVRFQKRYLADYLIGCIMAPQLPLTTVVAASSAFPPVLSPVTIPLKQSSWRNVKGTRFFGKSDYMRELRLTDGGAYDNLGLESVGGFNPVIVSDAGMPFLMTESESSFWPTQLSRVLSITTDQARGLRRRLLVEQCRATDREVAMAIIDRQVMGRPAAQVIDFPPEMIEKLARLRTRLNRFSAAEQENLINWGWLSMDVMARSYLTNVPTEPPAALPFKLHRL